MSAFFAWAIAQAWPYLAAAGGLLAVAFGIHRKGKADALREAELKDHRHAQDVLQRADEARSGADRNSDGDGLRKRDQWQRD